MPLYQLDHSLGCFRQSAEYTSSEASFALQAMLDESAEAPGIEQLVNGAVATVAQTPAAAFPLSDMLVSLCTQDSGKNKQQVFASLVQHLKGFGPAAVSLLLFPKTFCFSISVVHAMHLSLVKIEQHSACSGRNLMFCLFVMLKGVMIA